MPKLSSSSLALRAFEATFDGANEEKAIASRGEFLRKFPLRSLKRLTLDQYIIGKGTPSFCAYVEAKTSTWAKIMGATANKFGIYYGRVASDPQRKYRFTKKYGNTRDGAFSAVKAALLDLIDAGKSQDFSRIDESPLSQLFKAKILSLYFPNIYLNVCSAEHLDELAEELEIPKQEYTSSYQHLLLREKLSSSITKNWSNPKFMSFLYGNYIRKNLNQNDTVVLRKPRKKAHRKVNFEDIADAWGKIGRMSEDFALDWEKNRLIGLGYPELIGRIDDRRERPSYGYDFLSHSSPGKERYIEVKSVGKERGGYRFYLSENERLVSDSRQHKSNYYFYLVFFGSDGKPAELEVRRAADLYGVAEVVPCSYLVRFDRE